ncbi:helix-turn-helix transcriptional regulator [Providencia heimbachae]|uniref:helix-turn-helix transcriptional regulator n=1 Tax=Providencia heimbachae TaxID=333962 RepID=UPI00083AB61E|nr:helix-turn-helix transcriptional regulator [Providencia heimbachae]SQH12998.1 putative zinc finger/helix-turn-helix protein, YgiT family [Providencia heimbachae]
MKKSNNIKLIRKELGLSQSELASLLEVSQSNISHYERGSQRVPQDIASRVINLAGERGVPITFDDIYTSR